jgi:hypothetical protein
VCFVRFVGFADDVVPVACARISLLLLLYCVWSWWNVLGAADDRFLVYGVFRHSVGDVMSFLCFVGRASRNMRVMKPT